MHRIQGITNWVGHLQEEIPLYSTNIACSVSVSAHVMKLLLDPDSSRSSSPPFSPPGEETTSINSSSLRPRSSSFLPSVVPSLP